MTTLFDSASVVKPTAFGSGLRASRTPRFEPSDSDRAWWAQVSNEHATEFDVVGYSRPVGRRFDDHNFDRIDRAVWSASEQCVAEDANSGLIGHPA
jgi:hypothetical protein